MLPAKDLGVHRAVLGDKKEHPNSPKFSFNKTKCYHLCLNINTMVGRVFFQIYHICRYFYCTIFPFLTHLAS